MEEYCKNPKTYTFDEELDALPDAAPELEGEFEKSENCENA